jgi:hypothetical protein
MKDFFRLFRAKEKQPPMNTPPPTEKELDRIWSEHEQWRKGEQPAAPEPAPEQQRGHLPHLRRIRNHKPPFELQDRDIHVIYAVHANRFLTASLLKLLFPPDKAKTPPHVFTDQPKRSGTNLDRRLSKLYHYGYLQRIRTELGGELYYALTNKGAQLLAEKQIPLPLSIDIDERNRIVKRQYIEHAVMVARFHTAIQCALREHPTLQLDHYERESLDLIADWKRENQRVYVKPDAFIILKDRNQPDGKQRTAYFLEADRSTMHLPRLLEKYDRYSKMYADRIHQEAFGIPSFRVLTVCKSKERATNILKLAASVSSPIPSDYKKFFYFTTEELYTDIPENIFSEIWKRADEPKPFRSILRADPLPRV